MRRVDVPMLQRGDAPLSILHVSDLHLLPSQSDKLAFVSSLAELRPDFVLNTGDTIADAQAVGPLLSALEPLLKLPGAFVAGSNDYFAPTPKNPLRYLLGPSKPPEREKPRRPNLPIAQMEYGLARYGWLNLRNRAARLDVAGRTLNLAGVDDPHLKLDVYPYGAFAAGRPDGINIGVAHAPYRRILSEMTADGADLIFAGHTHGGQLCVPGYGALVTNCDIDRRRVKGLSRTDAVSGRSAWLHVSAGLGTSPFAPARFACRPEVTLLTLRPVT
nr:metallophosphoesterase [Spelaeicoccus albus]